MALSTFIFPQVLRIVKPRLETLRMCRKMSMLVETNCVHPMKLNSIPTVFFLSLLFAVASPGQEVPASSATPVPYASVSQLNGMLAQLEQASQKTLADLVKLRIEKWKTDSSYKRQSLTNAESIRKNLGSALPEMINQLRSSPEDLTASFKLYRNLDALYDVLGTVAESAGAFGSKDEFQWLSNDLSAIERSRRAFADRVETLTASKESELSQLRTQVKTLLAATPPPPPKKVVVDDTEPQKPPPKKKTAQKTAKPPVPPTQPAQPQPQ